MFTTIACVGLVCLLGWTEAAYFPAYIKACSRSNPKFSECALEHGKIAMPSIVKGDKKLKLRLLDPLEIPEILIDSPNLKIHLVDSLLYGLSTLDLKDINVDLNGQKMYLYFTTPRIGIEGTYNISGQILILPITGSGKLEATIYDADIGYEFEYDLVERDGQKYMDPHPPRVTLEAPKSSYHLENLFNGDKRLGDEMNKFVNENHEVMLKEIAPSIRETISAIAQDIVQKTVGSLAYDDLFAP